MTDTVALSWASSRNWDEWIRDKESVQSLETDVLPAYLNTCRWFAGKARRQEWFRVRVFHSIPVDQSVAYLLIVEVGYGQDETETYQLPLSLVEPGADVPAKGIVATAAFGDQSGLLIDAIYDRRFRDTLFRNMADQTTLDQADGVLRSFRGKGLVEEDGSVPESRVLPVDSSNSALAFGDRYFMKLYRKLFRDTNPEVDMVSFMTEYSSFRHIPAYAGSLVWRRPEAGGSDITLGMMQQMVENQKDSWAQTGDYLNDFLYAVPQRLFTIREDVFDRVELLAQRTGEMHLALYAPRAEPDFAPESFTDDYREFLIRRLENLLHRRYELLIDNYQRLDPQAQRLAWVFMEAKEMIDEFIDDFRSRPIESLRTRIHGDYHLGQVLATGHDFIIIDFEGEPESSIAERKIKHSPLKDVAGMIRSYHYAVSAKLFNSVETAGIDPDQLQRVSDRWFKLIRDTFMEAYLKPFGIPHPLFRTTGEMNFLLLVYLLEKAVYELGYEISYRPAWVKIPLKGIVDVIREIEKLRVSPNLTGLYL